MKTFKELRKVAQQHPAYHLQGLALDVMAQDATHEIVMRALQKAFRLGQRTPQRKGKKK